MIQECGILTEGGLSLEGPSFRKMTPAQLDEIMPSLQVSQLLSMLWCGVMWCGCSDDMRQIVCYVVLFLCLFYFVLPASLSFYPSFVSSILPTKLYLCQKCNIRIYYVIYSTVPCPTIPCNIIVPSHNSIPHTI